MGYTVEHQKERSDYYVITLLFRPEGDWNGGGGQERFFIEKEGVVAHRQLLSLPRSTSSRRLMSITVLFRRYDCNRRGWVLSNRERHIQGVG